jgi:hypothetical protein
MDSQVNGGSIAERAGLLAGDGVLKINNLDAALLKHKEAQDAIVHAGNSFELLIQRLVTLNFARIIKSQFFIFWPRARCCLQQMSRGNCFVEIGPSVLDRLWESVRDVTSGTMYSRLPYLYLQLPLSFTNASPT